MPLIESQRLRYKDYQLLRKPAEVQNEGPHNSSKKSNATGVSETDAVSNFGAEMQRHGVLSWWRKAMEFDTPDDRL